MTRFKTKGKLNINTGGEADLLIPYARSASQEYSVPVENSKTKSKSDLSKRAAVWEQEQWTQEAWDQGPKWVQESWDQNIGRTDLLKRLKRDDEIVGKQIKVRLEDDKAFVQDLRTKMIFLTTVSTGRKIISILNKTFKEASSSNPEIIKLFEYKRSA
jgi:hypothetical protein